jgi:hypothetical protein
MQGCPLIEEASYKLLSETIYCAGDKDDARKDNCLVPLIRSESR